MRQVLESPSPLTSLASLVKAQQVFHTKSSEILAAIEGEIEESAIVAEGEFRKTRG